MTKLEPRPALESATRSTDIRAVGALNSSTESEPGPGDRGPLSPSTPDRFERKTLRGEVHERRVRPAHRAKSPVSLPPHAQGITRPRFEPTDPATFPPLAEMWARGVTMADLAPVRSGFVTVPQNRTGRASGTMRLPVLVLGATERADSSPGPRPAPLVLLNGGPGTSSLAFAHKLTRSGAWNALRKHRDVVLVTERGTQFSIPELKIKGTDALPPSVDPDGTIVPPSADATVELVRRARQELVAGGVDLGSFNLYEMAADVHDALRALGYLEYNLYGVSFGTLFAQAIAKRFPKDVRSLALDGPAMSDRNTLLDVARTAEQAFEGLFEAARAKYPNLKETFVRTVEALNAHPHVFEYEHDGPRYRVKVTGAEFFKAVSDQLSDERVLTLPKTITEIAAAPERLEPFVIGQYKAVSPEAIYLSVMGTLWPAKPEDVPTQGIDPLFARCVVPIQKETLEMLKAWRVPELEIEYPGATEPVKNRCLPALVMPGRLDGNTDPAFGRRIVANLPSGFLVEVPDRAHVVMDPEIIAMMNEFFDDPTRRPASADAIASRVPAFA